MSELKAWRERLIRLPESTFLDLIRNYLGEVRTPFNKQELLGRLEAYLCEPERQARIACLLSLRDRQTLSAVRLAAGAGEDELFRLVGDGRSFIEFHLHILNLEDRLLVYREHQNAGLRIAPPLAPVLEPYLAESLVVASEAAGGGAAAPPWAGDAFLAAVFAFLRENGDAYTAGNALKKRFADDFARRFASVAAALPAGAAEWSDAPLRSACALALAGLERLGLAVSDDGVLKPDPERWDELAALDPERRRWLYWGACLAPAEPSQSAERHSAYFNQGRIAAFASALVRWLGRLAPDRRYSMAALALLWDIHAAKPYPGGELTKLLRGLALLGVLLEDAGGWRVNPALRPAPAAPAGAGLILTPSFELRFDAGLAFTDALALAAFAGLDRFGELPNFQLTRASCHRGLADGRSADAFLETVRRNTPHPVPQNVAFSVEEWRRDFEAVRLYDGVVLVADGQRRAQVEHLPGLAPWVLARPAPGVLVLDRQGADLWLPLLAEAGIALPAGPISTAAGPGRPSGELFLPPLASLDLDGLAYRPAAESGLRADAETGPVDAGLAEAVRSELARALAEGDFSPELREELTRRMQGRLLLAADQVSAEHARVEKWEARGLDYSAKVRLIEQVIKGKRDFVELTQQSDAGGTQRLLVWPQKLRQTGHDLLLSAQTVPEGKEIALSVGKALLARRIRASIFG